MSSRWGEPRKWACRVTTEAEVGECLASFDAYARQVRMADGIRREAAIVLDEMLTNAVRYGLGGSAGALVPEAAASARLERNGASWEIRISDPGPAFNPIAAPRPAVERPLAERVPGGVGLELVRRLASRMTYERRDDENHLVVRLDA